MPDPRPECFISVDVETAGPHPLSYSLLSIGACLVDEPETGFYIELKPIHQAATDDALAVAKLSLEDLAVTGASPEVAMQQFADWVAEVVPEGHVPVFTGFNSPFDWMYINTYFHEFIGFNPFGHSALDIKSYFMGKMGSSWAETSMNYLSPRYLAGRPLSHNALSDARDQAELFRAIRANEGPNDEHPRRNPPNS
jgi:ribonuclease T